MSAALKGPQGNIELGSTITRVGRSPENQLIVNDTEASWFHAQLYPQGQGHIVVDLGSRIGTFVNGQRLPPNTAYRLNPGDVVRFGNTTFNYMIGASPHPPTRVAAPGSMPTTGGFQQQQPSEKQDSPPQKDAPTWVKIVGGLASLASVFAVIWGVYTYIHPNTPPSTPTPSSTPTAAIPRLHPSYNGSMVDEHGQPFILLIASLDEDANGNFTARGEVGSCIGTLKGTINSDNSIHFTLTEDTTSDCGLVGTFSGKLFPDDHIAGDWQGASSGVGGTWTAK